MNKKRKIVIATLLSIIVFWLLFPFLFANTKIGFPAKHAQIASCIGYKVTKDINQNITHIYCYGIMYNLWLE